MSKMERQASYEQIHNSSTDEHHAKKRRQLCRRDSDEQIERAFTAKLYACFAHFRMGGNDLRMSAVGGGDMFFSKVLRPGEALSLVRVRDHNNIKD